MQPDTRFHEERWLRVVAITAGSRTPAARFRVGQLRGHLRECGIDLLWKPAIVPKHPPQCKWVRPLWLPAAVASRVPAVMSSWAADVTLLLREMVSTLITLEPLTKSPRVLDVDDAIWLHRGGGFAKYLARHVNMVIAGNSYLADWFGRWNPNTVVLPTAVDTDRYRPSLRVESGETSAVIGWSGTSGNFRYLYMVEPAIAEVLQARPTVRFRVLADRPPRFTAIPEDRLEFIRWTPENEVSSIQGMDIGIMPLEDSEWAKGKCSYKMLLYMACGLPVIVSPVGMNAEILAEDSVGLAANTLSEWVDAMEYLLDYPAKRRDFGNRGRKLVCARYSTAVIAPQLALYLRSVAR